MDVAVGSLTRVELVEQLGWALGRELAFVESSRDKAVAALESAMGENAGWYVDNVLAGFATHGPVPTTTVQAVTGRPATTFGQWAEENAARSQPEQAEGPGAGGDGALGVVRVDQPLATVNGPAVPVTPLTVTVTQI